MGKIKDFLKQLNDKDVWNAYALIIAELQSRKLIRTKNIVGERGEFLAIEFYNNTPGLPNLQAAPEGTQNVDALSRKGDRYSIKTISEPAKTTGVFYGCGNIDEKNIPEQKFEHVIVVIVDKNLQLKKIYEITWKQFLKFRKWHKTMRAWNLYTNKTFLTEVKVICDKKD
jgi:hypothetical protein